MEESLKFNSQICTTREQSQRLLDLGLKPETADMMLTHNIFSNTYEPLPKTLPTDTKFYVPAWSLHRLIELMDVYEVILEWKFGIYECAISMLEERIKDGLINKEYLKQ